MCSFCHTFQGQTVYMKIILKYALVTTWQLLNLNLFSIFTHYEHILRKHSNDTPCKYKMLRN